MQEIDDEDDLIVEIADGIHVRIARRAIGGVVKPEDESRRARRATSRRRGADGEEPVNDSEEIVSEEPAEDPKALDRR